MRNSTICHLFLNATKMFQLSMLTFIGTFATSKFEQRTASYRSTWFTFFLAELTMMRFSRDLFCREITNVCSVQKILRDKNPIILE